MWHHCRAHLRLCKRCLCGLEGLPYEGVCTESVFLPGTGGSHQALGSGELVRMALAWQVDMQEIGTESKFSASNVLLYLMSLNKAMERRRVHSRRHLLCNGMHSCKSLPNLTFDAFFWCGDQPRKLYTETTQTAATLPVE